MKNSPQKWLIPILIIALAIIARLIPGTRTIDDAFITFRYAQNLLAGSGLVFNPGEQVLGTTTPLYALLMAALALPLGGTGAPFPALALVVNTLADAATCLLLWQIGKRLVSDRSGLIAALVWAVAPYSVTFAIGGLETSMVVFLLTLTVWAYLTDRLVLTALSGAFSLLVRPDALILVGPLILDRFWRAFHEPRKPIRRGELLVFLIPLALWGAIATIYFGSPLPHSIMAKLAVYRLQPWDSLIRLLQHYATPFNESLWGGSLLIGIGLVLYPVLFIIGARRALKVDNHVLAWILYPWLYFLAFSLPNPLLFRWYLTPPLPSLIFFILLGLETVLMAILRTRGTDSCSHPSRPGWKQVLITLVMLLPLVSTLNAWELHPDHGANRPAPKMAFIKLELLYGEVADLLKGQIQPGETLAAGDVGVLGYRTGARILDTVGLNSPVSLQYYPVAAEDYVINYTVPTDLILNQRPAYAVFLEAYIRNTLLKDQRFLKEYGLVRKWPTDLYGSDGLLLFKRIGS
jgi:hypothetical protein